MITRAMQSAIARRVYHHLWVGVVGCCMLLGVTAQARETIVWGMPEFPPFSIQSGPHKNEGVTDYVRALLRQRMADMDHIEVAAPIPRIANELKAGQPWCWIGAIKTPERERFAHFSVPFALFLPQQIIVHSARRAQLEALARTPQGTLSLGRLLSHRALRMATLRGRSYGGEIDQLLARYGPLSAYSSVPEALQMILADRLDFVIEYPAVAQFYAHAQERAGELEAVPFDEMADIVPGYIACAKTAWGGQMIQRINRVLLAERDKQTYRAEVERWNPPEAIVTIRRRYTEVLGRLN